jgi:hypothetical protein
MSGPVPRLRDSTVRLLVSKELAMAVWDNTRTKDILNQDNPELCERIAGASGRTRSGN